MVLSLAARLALGVRSKLNEAHRELDRMLQRMEVAMRLRLARETHRLDLLSQRLEGGNPSYLLEKGYALVQQQGKKVARAAALQPEQELEIQFLDGVVRCQVMEVTQKETK
jgi:exodeoxyribonuclease VII large subunit